MHKRIEEGFHTNRIIKEAKFADIKMKIIIK
jgi:hypothetical protein